MCFTKIWRRLKKLHIIGKVLIFVILIESTLLCVIMEQMAMEKVKVVEAKQFNQVSFIELGLVSGSAITTETNKPQPLLLPKPTSAASITCKSLLEKAVNAEKKHAIFQNNVATNSAIVPTVLPTVAPTLVPTPVPTTKPSPKPTKKPNKKKSEFSKYKDEEYLFAQMIMCEVGGEGEDDMVYAGSVILNRARTGYKDFADVNTITEVLYQGYGTKMQQYATTTIQKIQNGIKPSKEVKKVAKGLLNGTIKCLDESILFQTEFVPKWKVKIVSLPGANEVYSSPTDFEEYRKSVKKSNKE